MPADPVEIHDAEEEGVKFHYLCNPVRIVAKEGRVVGVECIGWNSGSPMRVDEGVLCPSRVGIRDRDRYPDPGHRPGDRSLLP